MLLDNSSCLCIELSNRSLRSQSGWCYWKEAAVPFLCLTYPSDLYSAICSSEDPNRSGWHQNIQGSKMPPLQEQKLYGSNPNAQTQKALRETKNIENNQGSALQRMEPTAQRLVQTYPHAPNMSQFLWAQVPIDPTTLALFHQPQLYTPSLTAFALSSLSAASSKQVAWEPWRGAFCFRVFSYIAELKE